MNPYQLCDNNGIVNCSNCLLTIIEKKFESYMCIVESKQRDIVYVKFSKSSS